MSNGFLLEFSYLNKGDFLNFFEIICNLLLNWNPFLNFLHCTEPAHNKFQKMLHRIYYLPHIRTAYPHLRCGHVCMCGNVVHLCVMCTFLVTLEGKEAALYVSILDPNRPVRFPPPFALPVQLANAMFKAVCNYCC